MRQKKEKVDKRDELTFDQEVFGVTGTAGEMVKSTRMRKPLGNPYTYGY